MAFNGTSSSDLLMLTTKPRLNIALDFDGTWTLNPKMWTKVVEAMDAAGFDVWIVTMRKVGPELEEVREAVQGAKIKGIIGTDRKAKKLYVDQHHPMLYFHVWIDDNPFWIINDAKINLQKIEHDLQFNLPL